MEPWDVFGRLLNPGVVVTVALSGLAYGVWLWSLNLRPTITLYFTAVWPGVLFLLTIWAIRGLQGTLSVTYLAIFINWLIFSHCGVASVLVKRRRRGGK
jgi:hypothetical protein